MSRYEIGYRNRESKNIYYTGVTLNAPSKADALTEYIRREGSDEDVNDLVINLIEE